MSGKYFYKDVDLFHLIYDFNGDIFSYTTKNNNIGLEPAPFGYTLDSINLSDNCFAKIHYEKTTSVTTSLNLLSDSSYNSVDVILVGGGGGGGPGSNAPGYPFWGGGGGGGSSGGVFLFRNIDPNIINLCTLTMSVCQGGVANIYHESGMSGNLDRSTKLQYNNSNICVAYNGSGGASGGIGDSYTNGGAGGSISNISIYDTSYVNSSEEININNSGGGNGGRGSISAGGAGGAGGAGISFYYSNNIYYGYGGAGGNGGYRSDPAENGHAGGPGYAIFVYKRR